MAKLSIQANIAAACYAVIIVTAMLGSKTSVSNKVFYSVVPVLFAIIAVCVINCYTSGGCGVLAWLFAGLMIVSAAGTILMVVDHTTRPKRETLVFTGNNRPVDAIDEEVPMAATPP